MALPVAPPLCHAGFMCDVGFETQTYTARVSGRLGRWLAALVGVAVTIAVAAAAVVATRDSSDAAAPPPPGLAPLVDGHNRLDADRINLVFAPWGWDDKGRFREIALKYLAWDGNAATVDQSERFTDDKKDAVRAEMGLFAIEPWRSNRDLFNVWYTEREPDTPVSWLNGTTPDPFPLPDLLVVTLAADAYRFNPELGSVAGQDGGFVGPAPPKRLSDDPFDNVTVVVDSTAPAVATTDVPHELGHAMFGFADEYSGDRYGFDGRSDLSSWPACAEDRAEAERWWGDLVGAVDPMTDVWFDERKRAGFPVGDDEAEYLRSTVRVGYIARGCYAVPGSIRATKNSLMHSNMPVLGSVNRRWAERVIALWTGAPRP